MIGANLPFGEPAKLILLGLVPLLAGALMWAQQRRRAALDALISPDLQATLCDPVHPGRHRLRLALLCTAVACMLVALARPQWGESWESVQGEGVDLVIAIDVSDSMLVQDVQQGGQLPRLEQAKRNIVDLLRIMQGDRVGLVAFAGTAYVECPLTLDYHAAAIFLDDIDTNLISTKGTALGDGIRTALAATEGAEHSSSAIVLITDGEDQGTDALAAAEEAHERGVPIYPIGIGRPEGAPIPLPNGGFHRDSAGNVILSKLDEATLQQIARITGGLYTHSMAGEVDLERIYTEGIRGKLQAQQHGSQRRQRGEEHFAIFLAVAWLALAWEGLLSERPFSWRPKT
jgi:Ca-activated chloride channel family protein